MMHVLIITLSQDKNKDGVLRYMGNDKWAVLSGDDVVSRYTTDDLRISIVYRARCFASSDTADSYRNETYIMDLERDIIDTLKGGLVSRGVATAQKLATMGRLELAFLIIDSYIKYPLPPVQATLIPFNYCAAPLLYPWVARLPFFDYLCSAAPSSRANAGSMNNGALVVRPLQGTRFAAEVLGVHVDAVPAAALTEQLRRALDLHKGGARRSSAPIRLLN